MSINGIGYPDYRSNMMANKRKANRTESYPQQRYAQERTGFMRAGQNAGVQEIYAAFQGKNPYVSYVTDEEESHTSKDRDLQTYRQEKVQNGKADAGQGSEETEVSDADEQKTDTEIIVKADGSKIMMTTVRVGGTETVMSMEIAKPADDPTTNPGTTMENPNMMVSDTSDAIEAVSEKLQSAGETGWN